MNQEIQNYFKENDYVVIRNFLTPELSAFMYNYCKIKVQSSDLKYVHAKHVYNDHWDGSWAGDEQVNNSFYQYGDPAMESLLELSKNCMEQYTGLSLLSNYSYWRFYQKGNVLERHTDRESCEISTTLCLGYDVSNVDKTVYPDYKWAMFIKDKAGNEIPVAMNPGDMIVYRGDKLEHWREPFKGLCHAQVFMHYNDANGPYKINYDGRPILGVPKYIQF
jgi:hypothetical protein